MWHILSFLFSLLNGIGRAISVDRLCWWSRKNISFVIWSFEKKVNSAIANKRVNRKKKLNLSIRYKHLQTFQFANKKTFCFFHLVGTFFLIHFEYEINTPFKSICFPSENISFYLFFIFAQTKSRLWMSQKDHDILRLF